MKERTRERERERERRGESTSNEYPMAAAVEESGTPITKSPCES